MEQLPTPNPLNKYFRTAGIHVKLPSDGKYWADGALQLPVTGEIPVLPMTAKDEILLKTPDALLNGSGIVEVMQDCCPSIVDGWQMPSVDVDYVLIAIRIASFGHNMEISAECPHCKAENDYDVDLRSILDGIKMPDYATPVTVDDLRITLMPQRYFSVTQTNRIEFEEEQIIKSLHAEGVADDVKEAIVKQNIAKVAELNIQILTDSTESITTPESVVVDKKFIREFYENTSNANIKSVKKRLRELNAEAAIKPVSVSCNECEKEFDIAIEFDYSNFFASGS